MSRALALVDSALESRKYEKPNAQSLALLETKLYVPPARAELVARPRLFDALGQEGARLTVVVAPAGFGKTTLLSTWLADSANDVGWVSLDPTENDPALFWSYFVRALQHVRPDVGASALTLLRSSRAPEIEQILTGVINEVDASATDFTVVLDDYHVIDADEIHDGLTFLVDHLPRRMRLVIASRAEPPLPVARLRARGELAELRIADMRFTPDEATAFLTRVMGLALSRTDAAKLEQRTEGWIAGLKLAALSMKARGDVHGFVDDFSGDNRYVADYLVDEVLKSETDQVRRFLLGTSMLDRLNGSLCDAVTGDPGSQLLLEDLERRSLFVVPCDDRREWFRYHHLFAEVLQKLNRNVEAARAAHGRASIWHEGHGSTADAIRHALAAQDLERAAQLLERNWPEKDRSYESANWLARVKTLPIDLVRQRPALSMGYAWGLINSGELEAAEPRLQDVERWLETNVDARLSSELAAARVYVTQSRGDSPGTLEHARRVLALAADGDDAARATGTALVALAHWSRGELEAAHRAFTDALVLMRSAGHELDAIRGTFVPADVRVSQGRLREAAAIYEEGLRSAQGFAAAETDELHLGLSEVHREWNDLGAAVKHLDAMSQTAQRAAHKANRLRWGAAMARVCEAQGDLDRAFELLDEAERHERRDPVPRVRPIPAHKARIRIAQGRADDAMAWVRAAKVSVHDDLTYLREYEHITLARMLVARSSDEALPFLDRLRGAAQSGGRVGSVIEVQVLQSVALHATGNSRGAVDALNQALALAEPERFLRVFLDEGNRMRELLKIAIARGLAGDYARRVLAAFDAPKQVVAVAAAANPGIKGLEQPLTTREHEILRLIAAGLRNQEIADQLSISAATVKRHIANAYGKLGVGHRTEALARAAELKLL